MFPPLYLHARGESVQDPTVETGSGRAGGYALPLHLAGNSTLYRSTTFADSHFSPSATVTRVSQQPGWRKPRMSSRASMTCSPTGQARWP